jgi:hypothetical protein
MDIDMHHLHRTVDKVFHQSKCVLVEYLGCSKDLRYKVANFLPEELAVRV